MFDAELRQAGRGFGRTASDREIRRPALSVLPQGAAILEVAQGSGERITEGETGFSVALVHGEAAAKMLDDICTAPLSSVSNFILYQPALLRGSPRVAVVLRCDDRVRVGVIQPWRSVACARPRSASYPKPGMAPSAGAWTCGVVRGSIVVVEGTPRKSAGTPGGLLALGSRGGGGGQGSVSGAVGA